MNEQEEYALRTRSDALIAATRALTEAARIIGPMREIPAVSRFLTLYSDFLEKLDKVVPLYKPTCSFRGCLVDHHG